MITRRDLLAGAAALAAFPIRAAEPLTLWGIPATPSAVFARAADAATFQAAAPGARFDIWKSTDEMRAGIATGRFRLFATSTYAAANFRNRGAGTVMVNVVTWGVLYVMARDDSIRSLADLAGKHVLLSNRNEAPDLLFRMVAGWEGLEPSRDMVLDYVGSPGEAVPLFLSGRGDVAVMHEPASTLALMKGAALDVPVVRALDITEIYGAHTGRGPRIPQVGLAASAEMVETAPEVIAAAHTACAEASDWALANPDEAGALTAPALGLPAPLIARSLPFVHLGVASAAEAREDIELYFENLMAMDPGIVGGRLPDPGFYWG